MSKGNMPGTHDGGGMGVLESLLAGGHTGGGSPATSPPPAAPATPEDLRAHAARFILPMGPNDELAAEEVLAHIEAQLEVGGRLATALQGHDVSVAARQTARDRIAVLTLARALAFKLAQYQPTPPTMPEIVDLARYLSGR